MITRQIQSYIDEGKKQGKSKKELLETLYLPKTLKEAKEHTFNFWDTQPVLKVGVVPSFEGPINEKITLNDNPTRLPPKYCWNDLRSENSEELTNFLNIHYVTYDEIKFRNQYNTSFFEWYLRNPNIIAKCVRVNNKIVGTIIAEKCNIIFNSDKLKTASVNFLCVHKMLRYKRLTPVLIKEIARCIGNTDILQGEFATINYLSHPILSTNYYHFPLDYKKLLKFEFCELEDIDDNIKKFTREEKIELMEEKYFLPKTTSMNITLMTEDDIEDAHDKLNSYLEKYNYHRVYSLEEFKYIFYGNSHVTTYVIKDENGEIEDIVSYYCLTKVCNMGTIKGANLFMYTSTINTPTSIVKNAQILAKNKGYDLFTLVNIMENNYFTEGNKFIKDLHSLHYYMYNWSSFDLQSTQVARLHIL